MLVKNTELLLLQLARVFPVLLCLGVESIFPVLGCWPFVFWSDVHPVLQMDTNRNPVRNVMPHYVFVFVFSAKNIQGSRFLFSIAVLWVDLFPSHNNSLIFSLLTVLDDCPHLHIFASLDSCFWNNYLSRHTGKWKRWLSCMFTIGSITFSF